MSRSKGTFDFSANFESLIKAPLDARQLVGTFSDLLNPATWDDGNGNNWLFSGAIVSVSADSTPENNGIYFLKDSANFTGTTAWQKVGSGGSNALSGLTDITIINPHTKDILQYSGGTWINTTPEDIFTFVQNGQTLKRSGSTIVGYSPDKTFVPITQDLNGFTATITGDTTNQALVTTVNDNNGFKTTLIQDTCGIHYLATGGTQSMQSNYYYNNATMAVTDPDYERFVQVGLNGTALGNENYVDPNLSTFIYLNSDGTINITGIMNVVADNPYSAYTSQTLINRDYADLRYASITGSTTGGTGVYVDFVTYNYNNNILSQQLQNINSNITTLSGTTADLSANKLDTYVFDSYTGATINNANNGLHKSGHYAVLGGSLTGNTRINIDNGNLYITGTSSNSRPFGIEINKDSIGIGDYFDGSTGKAYIEVFNSNALKAIEMTTIKESNDQFSTMSVHDEFIGFNQYDYRYGQASTSTFQAIGQQFYFGVDDGLGNGKQVQLSTAYALRYMGDYTAAINSNGSTLVTADWVNKLIFTGATNFYTLQTEFGTLTGTTLPAHYLNKTGGTLTGNLNGTSAHFTGNLTVDGTFYTVHAQHLQVADDYIFTRSGATSGLGVGQLSGLAIKKADGTHTVVLGADLSAIMRVGWSGGTMLALAAREDSPHNNWYARWDSGTTKFNTVDLDTTINAKLATTLFNTYTGTTAPGKYAQKSLAITGGTLFSLSGGDSIMYSTPVNGNKLQFLGLAHNAPLTQSNNGTDITFGLDLTHVNDLELYRRNGQTITGVSMNYFAQKSLAITGSTSLGGVTQVGTNSANKVRIKGLSGGTNITITTGATVNTIVATADSNKLNTSIYSTYTGTTAPATYAQKHSAITGVTGNVTLNANTDGKIIQANGTFTITLPNGMATGYKIDILNIGTGTITIAATTTFNAVGTKLATQYTGASIYHAGSNIWYGVGLLTT